MFSRVALACALLGFAALECKAQQPIQTHIGFGFVDSLASHFECPVGMPKCTVNRVWTPITKMVITGIVCNTAAKKSELRPGDEVIAINGRWLRGLIVGQMQELLFSAGHAIFSISSTQDCYLLLLPRQQYVIETKSCEDKSL